MIGAEADRLLTEKLDQPGNGFSYITMDIRTLPDTPIVVGFGRFSAVYGFDHSSLHNSHDGVTVLVGSGVRSIRPGDEIGFGDYNSKATVDGILPQGAAFISTGSLEAISLDKQILILTSYQQWKTYYAFSQYSEIISNTCLLNADEAEVRQYCEGVSKNGPVALFPDEFNKRIQIKFNALFQNGMTLLIFFIIILVFITVSISANISLIIGKNIREYGVHALCGARTSELAIRMLIFLMILVIMPMALVYSLYSSIRSYSVPLLILEIVLTCAMISAAAILPIRRIKNNDLTVLFRRD